MRALRPRTAALLATAAVAAAIGAAMPAAQPPVASPAPSPTQSGPDEIVVPQACTGCHALPSPVPWPAVGAGSLRFARHVMKLAGADNQPAIANVRFLDLDGNAQLQVVADDMIHGLVMRGSPLHPERGLSVIEHVPNPCHTTLVDLDRDGRMDLLIADLGDVPPADHLKGSVVWLQRLADGGYRKHTLASGLPRVADVQAADFDGD